MQKKLRLSDDDYIYASARVRARAAVGADNNALIRMVEADDSADIYRMLSDCSVSIVYAADGTPDIEATLDGYLNEEFNTVCGFMPESSICGILRYPYDAHNIKAVVKSEIRGIKCDGLLIDLGTVSAEAVCNAVRNRRFDLLPKNMGAGLAEALRLYAQCSDPEVIDRIIDKACYKDMLELANSCGKPFFAGLVRKKIDVTNILSAIRVIRLNSTQDYFDDMFIDGGMLGLSFFEGITGTADAEEKFISKLSQSGYSYISAALGANRNLSAAELACENCYIAEIKSSYSISYGAEVPFAYLAIKDYEVKNLRIIFISKKAGVPSSEIRKRLRGI